MIYRRPTLSPEGDPGRCRHRRFLRAGIQRAPLPPYRLYLLTCRECGTTLTTQTVRNRREASGTGAKPETALEEDLAVARRRRTPA
jgi:hypothetical protein